MKEHQIKIRIIPTDKSKEPSDTKDSFWKYVNNNIKKKILILRD